MTVMFCDSEDDEDVISSTDWTDVFSASGELGQADWSHMIWVNCEFAGVNIGELVSVRILVDDVERTIDHLSPIVTDQFKLFSTFDMIIFDASQHVIKIQAKCTDGSQTVKVRRKRILVMRH